MDTGKILELAKLFHTSGEKFLEGRETLQLSDSLLKDLNDSFTFLTEADGDSLFQVTHMNTEVEMFCDIQFLHDFIQKVLKVSIVRDLNTKVNIPLSVSKFKNLRVLELKGVPAARICGLQRLRTQLKVIVCSLCVHQLRDVLIACGGDRSTVGGVWEELVEASFPHNGLDSVDCSVHYTPWLQKIDLSYNNFKTLSVTTDLPNLKHLDLSFNILESIPVLSREASKKLEVLLLKNNYIKDLSGLTKFENMAKLDVSCNSLQELPTLAALTQLASLREVNLFGNPLSFHKKYRRTAIQQLHPNAVNLKVVLDGKSLNFHERLLVPLRRLPSPLRSHQAPHDEPRPSCRTERLHGAVATSGSAASSSVTSRRRVQVREAHITEHADSDADARDEVKEKETKRRTLVEQREVERLRKESVPPFSSTSVVTVISPTSVVSSTSPTSLISLAPSSSLPPLTSPVPLTSPAPLTSSAPLTSLVPLTSLAPLASSTPLTSAPLTSPTPQTSLASLTSPTPATFPAPKTSPTPQTSSAPMTSLAPPTSLSPPSSSALPDPSATLPPKSLAPTSPLLSLSPQPPPLPPKGKEEEEKEKRMSTNLPQANVDISGLEEGLVFAARCKVPGGGDEEGAAVLLALRGTEEKGKMEVEERDALSGLLKRRWPLNLLAHAEMLPCPPPSNNDSSIVRFHTLSLQHQDFVMDTPDAQALVRALCSGLSERSLTQLCQEEFSCLNCAAQFSREQPQHTSAGVNGRSSDGGTCPACSSRFICALPATPATPPTIVVPADAPAPTAASGVGMASTVSLQEGGEDCDQTQGRDLVQSRAPDDNALSHEDADGPSFFDVEPAPSLQEVFQGLLASVENRFSASSTHERVGQLHEADHRDIEVEDDPVVRWQADPTRVHHQMQLFAAQELLETGDNLLFAARASALPGGAAEPYPAVLLGSRTMAFLLRVLGPCRGWPGDWLRREAAWTWNECEGRVRLLPWGQGVATPLPLPCGRPLLLVTQDAGAARRLQQLIKTAMGEAEGVVAESDAVVEDDLWRRCPRLTPGKGASKEEINVGMVPDFVSIFTECSLGAHETPSVVRWGCVLLVADAELLLTAGDLRWLEPSPSYAETIAVIARRPISDLLEVASGDGRVELRWGQGGAWVLRWEQADESGRDEDSVGGGGQALLRALRPSWENLFRVPLRTLPLQ